MGQAMSALRRYVTPMAIVAAAAVLYIMFPYDVLGVASLAPSKDLSTAAAVVFWVLSILVVLALFEDRKAPEAQTVEIQGPAFTRYLFSNSRAGLLWLPIRLFVGAQWFEAGLHKAQGTGWLDGGAALKGFWTAAVAIPDNGHAPITYEWYRGFIQLLLDNHAYTWFAWLIPLGEMAVGLGLIFGILTGFAAFFGALMNMSFLLAGSASSNPVMFTLAVGLILAWRVAGYYGVDRYLLPMIGVPWRRSADAPSAKGGTAAPAPMTA
jgi:thiosulfate dehydrogenase (quinone) large subunit